MWICRAERPHIPGLTRHRTFLPQDFPAPRRSCSIRRPCPLSPALARCKLELQQLARALAEPPPAADDGRAALRARIAAQDLALRQSLELIWRLEAAGLEKAPRPGASSTEQALDAELAALRRTFGTRPPAPGATRPADAAADTAARREALREIARRAAQVRRRLEQNTPPEHSPGASLFAALRRRFSLTGA